MLISLVGDSIARGIKAALISDVVKESQTGLASGIGTFLLLVGGSVGFLVVAFGGNDVAYTYLIMMGGAITLLFWLGVTEKSSVLPQGRQGISITQEFTSRVKDMIGIFYASESRQFLLVCVAMMLQFYVFASPSFTTFMLRDMVQIHEESKLQFWTAMVEIRIRNSNINE